MLKDYFKIGFTVGIGFGVGSYLSMKTMGLVGSVLSVLAQL